MELDERITNQPGVYILYFGLHYYIGSATEMRKRLLTRRSRLKRKSKKASQEQQRLYNEYGCVAQLHVHTSTVEEARIIEDRLVSQRLGSPYCINQRQVVNVGKPHPQKTIWMGKEFDSIADCARYYNVNERTVKRWLNWGLNKYNKFHLDRQLYFEKRIYEHPQHLAHALGLSHGVATKIRDRKVETWADYNAESDKLKKHGIYKAGRKQRYGSCSTGSLFGTSK
jgi:hypothetical protein